MQLLARAFSMYEVTLHNRHAEHAHGALQPIRMQPFKPLLHVPKCRWRSTPWAIRPASMRASCHTSPTSSTRCMSTRRAGAPTSPRASSSGNSMLPWTSPRPSSRSSWRPTRRQRYAPPALPIASASCLPTSALQTTPYSAQSVAIPACCAALPWSVLICPLQHDRTCKDGGGASACYLCAALQIILTVRDPEKWYVSYRASLLWLYQTWWFKPWAMILSHGRKLQVRLLAMHPACMVDGAHMSSRPTASLTCCT